jgi:ATP-dependent Clp protease ATP-binding subunit ClpA
MTDDPEPTPRYSAILASAVRLARELGHKYVGAEHLFLAVIRDPRAIPTQVLAETTNLPGIEERLLSIMGSSGYSTGGSTGPDPQS